MKTDRRRFHVLSVIALTALVSAGCQETDPSFMSPLGVGAIAPELAATGWVHGTPESIEGKVVVVDCWAHW